MIRTCKVRSEYNQKRMLLNTDADSIFGDQKIVREIFVKSENPPFRNLLVNRLLAERTESDFARLLLQLQTISFKSGEVVHQSEDDFVYFPETAVFSQMNILEDGKTVETAMIGSEGMLGISSVLELQAANVWTQTLTDGSALRMNTKVFRQEFVCGGFLQTAFLAYLNAYIKQISQRAICNNYHRNENRFATWLLMLADRSHHNKLAVTQEQIAAVLGVQRPSITGIAQNLRRHGIIEYVRGRIILNRQKLEAAACECYAAIK